MVKVSKKRVCVIIPAYNEATAIGGVIKDVYRIFKKSAYRLSVVVINDGSTDFTARVAKKSGAIVISHIVNSGAGGATATGLRYAKKYGYDITITMDADGQHAAKDILKGVTEIDNTDIDLLIGSRLINAEGMSRVKIIGNKGLSLITFLLFHIRSTDSQSGLRVFSKRALEKLYWKTNGYEFCSEMLWRASQLNLNISEYPIQAIYTDYSKSKGQNNWNAINIIKSLARRRIAEMFG